MYWLTWVILTIAIVGAATLSYTDWQHKNICPKIISIPACYIVFSMFFIAAVMHQINNKTSNFLYFAVIGIPLFFASKGTIIELAGTEICPRSDSGTPMCFISLGFCISLILTKYFSIR